MRRKHRRQGVSGVVVLLTPPRSCRCAPAPPVMEFDADGNLIRAWGLKALDAGLG